MKTLILLIPIFLILSCDPDVAELDLPPTSPYCSVAANFSGIEYNDNCEESYAQSSNSIHKIYIISESEDKKMSGSFYVNNLDVGQKTITQEFNMTWSIGTEGTIAPSTILTNIEFEITSNDGSEISGQCTVPFDDEGFIILDTLWMTFENISIIE